MLAMWASNVLGGVAESSHGPFTMQLVESRIYHNGDAMSQSLGVRQGRPFVAIDTPSWDH